MSSSNTAFMQIIKWSGAMLVVAITLGFLYRIIMPVERHMDESEYQMRVFTEFESNVYESSDPGAPVFGTFEGGSVLYVIGTDTASASTRYLVRPFTVSGLDSVWIDAVDVTEYTSEEYRRWQYEEEIRKYGFDEEEEGQAEDGDKDGQAGDGEVPGDESVPGEGQAKVKEKVQNGE